MSDIDKSAQEAETAPETTPETLAFEPQILTNVHEFSWNFDQIKAVVAGHIEKYHGLVVTDENLKDMEKAQKEVAGVRISLDKFRKQVKAKMEEPYKAFELQVKELQSLVEDAEGPLKVQIQVYEDERIKTARKAWEEFSKKTAGNMGLRDEYGPVPIDEKWLNRGAKSATVRKEIVSIIEGLLVQQKNADDAAALAKQRAELIQNLCEVHSAGLKTPVTPAEVSHLLKSAELLEIGPIIVEACDARREMERRAAEAAAAPPMPPEVMSTSMEPVRTIIAPEPMPPVPKPTQSFDPPMPTAQLTPAAPCPPSCVTYRVVLEFPAITMDQAAAAKAFYTQHGINYKPISQEMIKK